jgi:adenylate cyclase
LDNAAARDVAAQSEGAMATNTGDQERRLVTVLFADLVGYTTAAESRDPELIQETLNLCFDRLADEIRRYGGYVDKVVGDSIMALFGAPRAQEDDAGKAIAAGLAMQRALDDLVPEVENRLGNRFHLRVGINTGLVVTGAVGPGAYTVTGDAVNVASRLETNAPQGGVLVGEASRRLARRQFQWGERRELQVKGRHEPVVCFVAEGTGPSAMRLVPSPSDTPYVGRNEHLTRLREIWRGGEHAPRVIEIVGEAGIGKTRVLAHLLALEGATEDQVVYTRADTPPRTFGPLFHLLPAIGHQLPAPTNALLGSLATGEFPEGQELAPDWLVDTIFTIMSDLSRRATVALVLDDMHRADDATLEVVRKLVPRLAPLPLIVFLLRQPETRRAKRVSAAESITLAPLANDDAAQLVDAAAPSLDTDQVAGVVARAGGNPLYLEVLAAATARAHGEREQVPDSLETAIVARVDDLDGTTRAVLREASVFGHSFLEEPLKLISETGDDVFESLRQLCDVGLLDEQPSPTGRAYSFRHSLVQQVLL